MEGRSPKQLKKLPMVYFLLQGKDTKSPHTTPTEKRPVRKAPSSQTLQASSPKQVKGLRMVHVLLQGWGTRSNALNLPTLLH